MNMIKWIIILVIGLIILGYLGFDIRRAVESPVTKSNIEYVKEVTVFVWTKYLSKPAKYLWNEVFVKLIWNKAINMLKREDEVVVKKDYRVKDILYDTLYKTENRV